MRIRYTVPATRTLDRALTYVAAQSPQGARNIQTRIQAIVTLLAQFPDAGRLIGRRQTRVIHVSPYPYLIYYRVGDGEVIIDAVRHTARRPIAQ